MFRVSELLIKGGGDCPSREIMALRSDARLRASLISHEYVREVAITIVIRRVPIDSDEASRAASDPSVYRSSTCWTWTRVSGSATGLGDYNTILYRYSVMRINPRTPRCVRPRG